MINRTGGKTLRNQLNYLEQILSKDKLKAILQEDYVGNPLLFDFAYTTSHNSVDHLFHFYRYMKRTKNKLNRMKSIVEWGGGYGGMAKIFQRLKSTPKSYHIIDIPLVSCIQWLYLTTIFGDENVNLLSTPEDVILDGKINLIPLCFLDNHKIKADLFISTWALSESSQFSQDYVDSLNWFNSKHFLLVYQVRSEDHPYAERVRKITMKLGEVIEEATPYADSYYIFL